MKPDSHREAAVEAAARAQNWIDSDGEAWEDEKPSTVEEYRDDARKVLDAARPHERAAFMEELAGEEDRLERLAEQAEDAHRIHYLRGKAAGLRAAFESIGEKP